MAVLCIAGVVTVYWAEAHDNPALHGLAQLQQGCGNFEGKETRFGLSASALFATVTTDASCGAVNSMHDSFTPLGGLVSLMNIQLGEVIFGGVGAGMYGMLIFVVLTVFIAGLMVIPALAIAGSMVDKKVTPAGPGTFPTNGWLFVGLLVSVVLIVGALTFFPALSLGPIVEHFAAGAGRLF